MPLLILVEGNFRFMDYLFVGGGVGIEQTLYDLLLLHGLGDNFGNVLRLYLEIADFLRVNDDNGALSQKPWQPVFLMSTSSLQALFFDLLFKSWQRLLALPEAWQADPEQSVMQGLFGSLFERMSFLNSSNSAGEFIRGIIFPYS